MDIVVPELESRGCRYVREEYQRVALGWVAGPASIHPSRGAAGLKLKYYERTRQLIEKKDGILGNPSTLWK